MILEQVIEFNVQIDAALAAEDLDTLRVVSIQCEQFLRKHLPLNPSTERSLERLVGELEQLVDNYKQAVSAVENAKQQAMDQLHSLSRNRSNTRKYLEVARHLGT